MKTVIGYCRVSSKAQEKSGLGLEAQSDAITQYAATKGYHIDRLVTETASGGLGEIDRPVLAETLASCRKAGHTILVAKLCRLSRDVHFMSGLDVPFESCELGPQDNSLVINLMTAVNQNFRDYIGSQTRAALAAKRARGEPVGNLDNLKGQAHRGSAKIADRALEFAESRRTVLELIDAPSLTTREIAAKLNELGVTNRSGGRWHPSGAQRVMQRLQMA